MPEEFHKRFSTGIKVKTGAGGHEFDRKAAQRAYDCLAQGIETSIANGNLIDRFIMSDRHTSGSLTTFVQYYLIFKFASGSYFEFTDADDNRREYCKGEVLSGDIMWRKDNALIVTVKLNFKSVWG